MIIKSVILFCITFFAASMQGIFLPRLFASSDFLVLFIPNVLLAVVFLCGALGGYLRGGLYGLAGGIVYGIFCSESFFLSLAAYFAVGLAAGILFRFLSRNIVFCLIASFATTFIFAFIQSIIASFGFSAFVYDAYNIIIVVAVSFSTTVAMVLLYYPVLWLTRRRIVVPEAE